MRGILTGLVISVALILWTLSVQSQSDVQVGYAVIQADQGGILPVSSALYSFRNAEGILVSEAGVTAVEPTRRGRIFVDATIPTGLALANPSDSEVTAALTLRDAGGNTVDETELVLPAGGHRARFVTQLFGELPEGLIGSVGFEVEGDESLAAVTIRQGTNVHGEPLFATLPVVDLDTMASPAGAVSPSIVFPHLAAGGSITTQIILINPTSQALSGQIQLTGSNGLPLELQLDGVPGSRFDYTLFPDGVFQGTLTSPAGVLAGYAVVTVEEGTIAPGGTAIFQFRDGIGNLISEAGVGAILATTRARILVDHVQTQTGVAIASPGNEALSVTFRLLDRNGFLLDETARDLVSGGHLPIFADQLFPDLPNGFTGILEIAAPFEVVPVTLKLTRNTRQEDILTTLPVADLTRIGQATTLVFPQVGFGRTSGFGEFSTRLIFIHTDTENPVSGTLRFFESDGSELIVPLGEELDSQFVWTLAAGSVRQFRPGNTATAQRVLLDPFIPLSREVTVNAGNDLRLTPLVVDSEGTVRDDFEFTFSSISPEVASVNSSGRITGSQRGFSTLTVSAGGVVTTVTITVVEVASGGGAIGVTGIDQDQAGRVYLADTRAHTVLLAPDIGENPEVYAGIAGSPGFQNGERLASRFSRPAYLALNQADASLFVSDSANHLIRKVNPGSQGTVETLAGQPGEAGSGDGPMLEARFRTPQGLAVDSRGGLWVADTGNHVVRRIDLAAGTVQTIAGLAGEAGAADGTGSEARFDSPMGLALEPASLSEQTERELQGLPPAPIRVIVADTGNSSLRRIICPEASACSDVAQVETIGSLTPAARTEGARHPGPRVGALTSRPTGVAVDPAGNIFVSEPAASRVLVVTPEGAVVPAAQPGSFTEPQGLALTGEGRLVVADAATATSEVRFGGPVILEVRPGAVSSSGGELMTVKGGNFAPESRVFIRGVEVIDPTVQDTQTIVFLAPALPSGRTTLTVQNRGGLAQVPLSVRPPDVELAPGEIATFAGGSNFTGDGSPATAAVLAFPAGLAVDSTGAIVISDQNNRIRRVDPVTGLITSIVGTGDFGFSGDGGNALAADLNLPTQLAFDRAGNLLISDTFNHVIRRVDSATGTIRTVAGTGEPGYSGDDGQATLANLNGPRGLAIDRSGNLFFADMGNHRVRRVDTSGIITTVAGTGDVGFDGDEGPASLATLHLPDGVALDPLGNLFIADRGNARIRRVDADTQIITTVAGDPSEGLELKRPSGILVDFDGDIVFSDLRNHRVFELDLGDGTVESLAGTGVPGFSQDGGLGTEAELNFPTAVAIDAAGDLLFAEFLNNRIRKVDALTGVITTVAGAGQASFTGDSGPATEASLLTPEDLLIDAQGNLLITDRGNARIRVVDSETGLIGTVAGTGIFDFSGDGDPALETSLRSPRGITLDEQGRLLIADTLNHRIRRVEPDGTVSTVAGTGSSGFSGDGEPAQNAELNAPFSVVVDAAGTIYFSDTGNAVIRLIEADGGIIDTLAGTGEPGFSGDQGPAVEADLFSPRGLALGPPEGPFAGGLYVADARNHSVRRIDLTSLTIDTVAGIGGQTGFSGDGGPAREAELALPRRIAFDEAGNLYIADTGNNVIRRVDAETQMITTVAGSGERGFSGDGGPAGAATLSSPSGLVFDSQGNLFLSEFLNGRVRMIRAPF